jgi:hypothetical protein
MTPKPKSLFQELTRAEKLEIFRIMVSQIDDVEAEFLLAILEKLAAARKAYTLTTTSEAANDTQA